MWHEVSPTLINSVEGKSKGIRKDEKRENEGKERDEKIRENEKIEKGANK